MIRKRTPYVALVLATSLLVVLACNTDSDEGKSEVTLASGAAMLPPGLAGIVTGSTMIIPANPTPPMVRQANCFAGVESVLQIGIGSVAGVTVNHLGRAMLPANINLGANQLGSYKIRITVSDTSAVLIDAAAVTGNNPTLDAGTCFNRGCPMGCFDYPAYYPPQFDPAPGFVQVDDVQSGADWITLEAINADLVNPTTGVVNIANIPIDIIGPIPLGGVVLTFQVELLKDSANADLVPAAIFHGMVAEKIQII